MANGKYLQPPPLNAKVVDDNKLLTLPWAAFFRDLLPRIGGLSAATVPSLESSITNIENNIIAIETQLGGIDDNELGVGPVL